MNSDDNNDYYTLFISIYIRKLKHYHAMNLFLLC